MNVQVIELTKKFLFASKEEMNEAHLTLKQQERLLRLRDMYEYWLENPSLTEAKVVREELARYEVKKTQAYEDVHLIKICLGNLHQSTKEYYRWVFIERCEEAFAMAREKEDPNAFARALQALGKFTGLDKDDHGAPDYNQIVPQNFEISSNPEDAGYKRIADIEKKANEMYKKMTMEMEDIPYEELKEPQYES